MAEPGTSSDPPRTNAEGAKQQKVEIGTSLFDHPAVVENVIAHLGLYEVLSLGSCSKYLNGVCESDCTWKLLYKRRWGRQADGESSEDALPVNEKRWKNAYIAKQKEWFSKISEVFLMVEQAIRDDCLSSYGFHGAIIWLKNLGITYDDIYSFFFSKKLKIFYNMLGLYYAYYLVGIPPEVLKKAIAVRGVIDRMVFARWTLRKTSSYGFYMPEENNMRVYSLGTVIDRQMSIICLMKVAGRGHLDDVSKMTITDKIPEPYNCITEAEKEHQEKPNCVGESSSSSA